MTIWALADLHLCLGAPDKSMECFGPSWSDYMGKIATHWKATVKVEDLVLIAGDISWALRLEQACKDLDWIDQLPGTKVMIRGNHDLWWGSSTQLRGVLPSSIHIISNDAFEWGEVSIGGSRLWDTNEYACGERIEAISESDEKIYTRELGRLEMSLKAMKQQLRLVMTHYPPLGFNMKESRISKLLADYGVSHCVFGHLHALNPKESYFGVLDGVHYHLTAADYLTFLPKKIL